MAKEERKKEVILIQQRGAFEMEEDNKEVKYRVGAYVSRETWEKIIKIQTDEKIKTGKKPSQGQILDKIIKEMKE